MMGQQSYLALDLGAESGRAVLGELQDGKLNLREVHRFLNRPCRINGRLHWDILNLLGEIKEGIGRGAAKAEAGLQALGVDTWGVDYGLLDAHGDLLGNPIHYRDALMDGILKRAFEVVAREDIFRQTGIQFLQFNTLFQLYALRRAGSPLLDVADRLLMLPDLFAYWLTGKQGHEYSIATTTQCFDPRKRDWAWPLLDAFDIPKRLFGEVAPNGSVLGDLSASMADELGIDPIPVALPASHDTGSAFVAVPIRNPASAVISCGTWSLVGAETPEPVIDDATLDNNFTNEGGAFGTNRLLTNMMGLWLLQQSRRSWARGGQDLDYSAIVEAAQSAPALAAWVDPDDAGFLNPPDMTKAIGEFCARSGQTAPEGVGPIARCILESLAMKHRGIIERLDRLLGRKVEVIHIVGGGSRNALLCQMTAAACGRPVIAGPAEATAMGNILVQAVAMGSVSGLEEARRIVRASTEIHEYEPEDRARWDEAYARFCAGIEAATDRRS